MTSKILEFQIFFILIIFFKIFILVLIFSKIFKKLQIDPSNFQKLYLDPSINFQKFYKLNPNFNFQIWHKKFKIYKNYSKMMTMIFFIAPSKQKYW